MNADENFSSVLSSTNPSKNRLPKTFCAFSASDSPKNLVDAQNGNRIPPKAPWEISADFPWAKILLVTTSSPEQSPSATTQQSESSPPLASESDILGTYHQKIDRLVEKCLELQMPLEAEITKNCWFDEQECGFLVPILSTEPIPDALPDDATSNQKHWYRTLQRLRRETADQVFELAGQAAREKRGYDAVRLMLTTLHVYPDHPDARRIYGYQLIDHRWRTVWEISRLNKDWVDHPVFGWLAKDKVERYEKGERYFDGKWIPASDETRLRYEKKKPWLIESEHYTLRTSHSLEEGVRLCRFLEQYYDVWNQFFYRFIANNQEWSRRFLAKKFFLPKRHHIIFYRNRQEYLEELSSFDKNVAVSTGGYFPDWNCIFVYASDDDPDNKELYVTIVHEATHQLFQECRLTPPAQGKNSPTEIGIRANFWVVEGISTYMETFRSQGNFYSVGGKDAFRFRLAQQASQSDQLVPLKKFVPLSREQFQKDPNLSALYTQAAGLTTFFLHGQQGKYRNAFIDYLFLVYQEQDEPDTLERLTGQSFDQLQEDYKNYMSQ